MFDFFVRSISSEWMSWEFGVGIGEEAQRQKAQRCREKTEWWKVEDKGVKR